MRRASFKVESQHIMQKKTCFVLDLDGTVYLGKNPITPTVNFIRTYWNQADFHFLSNNTSKTPASYVQRLRDMGIPASPDRILSPLDPLEIWVQDQKLHTIYAVANAAFMCCLKERLPDVEIFGPDCPDPDKVQAVLLAYDTELNYAKLSQSALLLQRAKMLFLATHPDDVCPSEEGPLPDVGSFLALYKVATGRQPDRIFGKPDPAVLAPLLARYPKEEMVMVGDRLSTDKQLAENAGIDFILVLSGESSRADLASLKRQPTLVLENLGEYVFS